LGCSDSQGSIGILFCGGSQVSGCYYGGISILFSSGSSCSSGNLGLRVSPGGSGFFGCVGCLYCSPFAEKYRQLISLCILLIGISYAKL
jgi:hypothetical protein